ncbi:MAG: hypothetical protein R3E90_12630 [Marinicella sp.]|nr:hypothetical protein [Xanthomonadales bacterium]
MNPLVGVLLFYCFYPSLTLSQSLPAHNPIDILIVSDEVNPHGLSDEQLMQPGDLTNALGSALTLNTHILIEVDTDQIELATQALNLGTNHPDRPEVLIYFSHRIPANDNGRQAEFLTAVDNFLQTGGGVISFHHGIYLTNGKQPIQDLLGSQATGAVPWDTVNGQDVIFVGENHFIGTHQINYAGTISYSNPGHGIGINNYPYFNNTPDERYPQMGFNTGNNGCDIDPLFESNYADNGNQHLLGYTKQCPNWTSKVFVYQPGEYQPNATSGNNFQILLNAIYYLSDSRWDVIFSGSFD